MKIDRTSLHPTAPNRRTAKSGGSGGGFAGHVSGDGAAAPSGGAPAAGVSNLDSLLALQEVPAQGDGRSQARQRGERLLDRLEELRDGLLMGRMSADTVRRLADEVDAARAETEDPRLNEILDEIDLRAQVELAKLRR
jgi:hypothetical protein